MMVFWFSVGAKKANRRAARRSSFESERFPALVTAVVGVAHQLGMRTVAEQVDRATLVTHLRALGVDDGQGFHLGRPRPLEALLDEL